MAGFFYVGPVGLIAGFLLGAAVVLHYGGLAGAFSKGLFWAGGIVFAILLVALVMPVVMSQSENAARSKINLELLFEVAAADAFRCDSTGCTTTVRGKVLAVSTHPAAVADDCVRAHILVLTFPQPSACTMVRGPVIDFFAARAAGTIALFIDGDRVRMSTVAQARGDRPWARSRDVRRSPLQRANDPAHSRLRSFAAPFDLGGELRLRPDVEDDDAMMSEPPEAEH